MNLLKHNLKQWVIAIDQLVNVTLGMIFRPKEKHYGDETMSSKAYRLCRDEGICLPRKIINILFFFDKNHCEESYHSERLGRHLPPELRS